jgi:hypothetical protein
MCDRTGVYNRWIPAKATCLPSSVLVVTCCVPSVKGEDELVSGFRPCLNLVLRFAMQTTIWEEFPQPVHYYHYSLERFLMSEKRGDLQKLLFLLISRISRERKCCCWRIERITNWRNTNPPIALPALIYCSIFFFLMLLQAPKSA